MSGGPTLEADAGGGFDFDAAFDAGDARPPAFDFGAEDPLATGFGERRRGGAGIWRHGMLANY